MLGAAVLALRGDSPLAFVFAGDGPQADRLARFAASRPNAFHLPALPVDEYRELLGACDVGMVATVPGVTSQSMPSKALDYLKAGLPAVVAVEPGNQFAELVEQRHLGRAVPFGDARAFLRAAEFLATNREFRAGLRERAYDCLAEIFDVRLAVSAILDACGERHDSNSSATTPALNAACVAK